MEEKKKEQKRKSVASSFDSHANSVLFAGCTGETEDTFIADISVGLATGQFKKGDPCRSERLAKYNQVMRDPSGISRGSGFVAFSTPEEASRALAEMNGKIVVSKPLYVAPAQRKEDRKAMLQVFSWAIGDDDSQVGEMDVAGCGRMT